MDLERDSSHEKQASGLQHPCPVAVSYPLLQLQKYHLAPRIQSKYQLELAGRMYAE